MLLRTARRAVLALAIVVAASRALSASCGPAWDFNTAGDLQGWWLANSLSGSVSGGTLNLSLTGADPYLYSPDNACIDAGMHKRIVIRMRNATASTTAELFWITAADPATHQRVAFSVTANDAGQRDYEIDLSSNPAWSGAIRRIRIDPSTAASGSVQIDSVRALGAGPTPTPWVPTGATPRSSIYSDTWEATDALGRSLPLWAQVGDERPGKWVAAFYFLWQGYHGANAIYDNTQLIAANPSSPAYGPEGAFHWWGKPEAGYYRSRDPWVARRNLAMLANAGVDVIFLDVTNAFTYPEALDVLCQAAMDLRAQGVPAPSVGFLINSSPVSTVQSLYSSFYLANKYPSLWFRWEGKPLMLGRKDAGHSQAVQDYFSWRYSWAWTNTPAEPDHWQWIDTWPQDYGRNAAGQIEEIPVSVAGHPTSNLGQSHKDGVQPPKDAYKLAGATGQGLQFEQQWSRAHQVDPPMVFVTGFNEWVAQRFTRQNNGAPGQFLGDFLPNGGSFFVDCYNQEYMRDIEPMEGGHSDNFYYQLVAHARRHKGVRRPEAASVALRAAVDGAFAEWAAVRPVYRDVPGDTLHRNYARYDGAVNLVNSSGRNDILEARVAADGTQVAFYAKAAAALSPYAGTRWMLLFIDSDRDKTTGWQGYDYAVNHGGLTASTTTLKRWTGSAWSTVASDIAWRSAGAELELALPRQALGLTGSALAFRFKWADNVGSLSGAEAFFTDGDAAPDRRFDYAYSNAVPYSAPTATPTPTRTRTPLPTPTATPGAAPAAWLEAESGKLNGVAVASSAAGYSHIGYVEGFDNAGDSVTVTFNAPVAGVYDLGIRYRAPWGDKVNDLYINGSFQGGLNFASTSAWSISGPHLVYLQAGSNSIRLQNNWGWFQVDRFELAQAALPALSYGPTLSDPAADAAARGLWCWLGAQYGRKVISGQTERSESEWIAGQTGRRPALTGFDMMDYSPSRVAFGASSTAVEEALLWAQQGGIVQFQWHWNAPSGLINTTGKEWWRGFYTTATTFDLAYALDNPSSPQYQEILRDLDAIAVQLKRLRDAGVPVLWRPLHEAEGAWFWWGAKGGTHCKRLYRLMYQRFTQVHGLHNLIWVWVSESKTTSLDWYPGDDVVDVVGTDIYGTAGDTGSLATAFYSLVRLYGGRKPVALTENGSIPDPDRMLQEGAWWSWFMTWSGYFIRDGIYNPPAHLAKVFGHAAVTTRDELPPVLACVQPSPTPTATRSATRTTTPSATRTGTPSATQSATPSATRTVTPSATRTVTPSVTRTATPSVTRTATPSATRTATPSVSRTATLSATPSVTVSATPSVTVSVTPSVTVSATPSATVSATPSVTVSATPSVTVSATPSVTVSATPSVTVSATPSVTVSATPSVTVSATPSPTQAACEARLIPGCNWAMYYDPVCGCDGANYSNDGAAGCHGVAVQHRGPCGSTPTATLSPSAQPSSTPAGGDGGLAILEARPFPHPQSGPRLRLRLRLDGPVDGLRLRLYTPAHVLVLEQRLGPLAGGWNAVEAPLPPDLAAGLYHGWAQAERGGAQSRPHRFPLYRLAP